MTNGLKQSFTNKNNNMDKIEINADNAKAAIEMADDNLKPVLEKLFGVSHSFKTYEDIKSFEDACKVVPPPPEHMAIISYAGYDKDLLATGAFLMLTHIARAMNFLQNGNKIWEPDWTNSSEYKYYPWLKYVAGSGFSHYGYCCGDSGTDVGSRLCFMTEAMARYAAKQFQTEYNQLFTL